MAAAQGRWCRQILGYPTNKALGTIIIDTPETYLYLTHGSGCALRYDIDVGREGFTWSGVEDVERDTVHRIPFRPGAELLLPLWLT